MFVWQKETANSGKCSMLFRAFEMLELTIGAYPEAQELDDKNDFEISETMQKLADLFEKKMPKALHGEEEED